MPVLKAVSSRATVGNALHYIEQVEKTSGGKLITSINCDVRTAQEEFEQVKQYYGKSDGRQYKHYVLSFDPKAERQPSPEEVLIITKELIQNTPHLQGFQSVIAVHTDRDHSHAHIIVNSVNVLTGQKLHEDRKDLQDMKKIQNEICLSYGFEPPQKKKEIGELRSFDSEKYKTIESKGENAEIVQVYQAVKRAKMIAELPEQFCDMLRENGIDVSWKDSRKYIVFTTVTGKKFRDKNLSKTFSDDISKESLTNEFCANRRSKQIEGAGRTADSRETEIGGISGLVEETKRTLADVERPTIYRTIQERDFKQPTISRSNGKAELETKLDELSKQFEERTEREREAAERANREEQQRIAREEEPVRPRKNSVERTRAFTPER